jgi:hypothetical protein
MVFVPHLYYQWEKVALIEKSEDLVGDLCHESDETGRTDQRPSRLYVRTINLRTSASTEKPVEGIANKTPLPQNGCIPNCECTYASWH